MRMSKNIMSAVLVSMVTGTSCLAADNAVTARDSTAEKLPPGYVRGDVVSYSYVPIRHWSPKEGIGILPYLFEYNLMEQKDGTSLGQYHQENIRRIDIASQWSTAIMLYPRHLEYRDEIINLMIRCFKRRQLIILSNYYDEEAKSNVKQYDRVREILQQLWRDRDKILISPEGDRATGLQLINNVLAVKLGDEGEGGLKTSGMEKMYAEFDALVRYWDRDGQQPFRHIRGWYNMFGYPALNYDGFYAANQEDADKHRRVKLPANTQAIGVDVYHYWLHDYSPFDPGDLTIPREKVRAHTKEWHRLRTQYYPDGLDVRVCDPAQGQANWIPECWNDTHALLKAIELAGAQEAMMWYIGVSGQIDATISKKTATYTTPIETMEMYYENLKAGPWVALSWWIFGTYKDTHGGLEYYDKTLKHYTPEHPEGVPYSPEMLEYWHREYVNMKMGMFNDVVYNQFKNLNGDRPPRDK